MRWWLGALILAGTLLAQEPAPTATSALKEPTITLAFDNPEQPLPHYTVAIGADGSALYEVPPKPESPAGMVTSFKVSDATREKAFALAKALNNLDGNFDFTKHRIAFSGWRTFTYRAGATVHTTRFNWSETQAANALASLFEGIAATLEAESRLRYLRKYDKLGLNEYLGNLEKRAKSGGMKELPLLSKVLTELSNDPDVMNIARQRAQRLAQAARTQ
jgi:hypothetical protein